MNLEKLNLSVRAYNCLRRAGITTTEDLCNMTTEDMIKVRNLGRHSFEEVIQAMKDNGITFQDENPYRSEMFTVDTGLTDKNGNMIKIGDITRLVLEDGEVRDFKVEFKTVKRVVKSYPDFDDEFATVNITGIVFCWEGYDLFPCIDSNGISDVSKMEIV